MIRRIRRSAGATGWVLASLVLLFGCGPAAEAPGAGNENRAAPEPSTASDSNQTAAPASQVLSASGYGPLRIGMSLADVVTALGPDSDPEAVGGPEPEQCDQFRPARAPEGLLVMIEAGRLTRISLAGESSIVTDKGLGVGATAAEVRTAYGPGIVAGPHKYQDPPAEYLDAWASGAPAAGAMAGENARGIRYEVGDEGRVTLIHAGGPSIEYVEGCL